jgi:hypothetical protein
MVHALGGVLLAIPLPRPARPALRQRTVAPKACRWQLPDFGHLISLGKISLGKISLGKIERNKVEIQAKQAYDRALKRQDAGRMSFIPMHRGTDARPCRGRQAKGMSRKLSVT